MKKTLLSALAIATLALTLPAHATSFPLTISLVAPDQTGTVGNTLQFFGVITNNTGVAYNIDSDDFTLPAGVSLTDDFDNTPATIFADGQPGASSGIIELFDLQLTAPSGGFLAGTYDLVGDSGGAQSIVGEVTFSVSSTAAPVAATPEPSSILLLLTGLPAAVLPLRKRIRRTH